MNGSGDSIARTPERAIAERPLRHAHDHAIDEGLAAAARAALVVVDQVQIARATSSTSRRPCREFLRAAMVSGTQLVPDPSRGHGIGAEKALHPAVLVVSAAAMPAWGPCFPGEACCMAPWDAGCPLCLCGCFRTSPAQPSSGRSPPVDGRNDPAASWCDCEWSCGGAPCCEWSCGSGACCAMAGDSGRPNAIANPNAPKPRQRRFKSTKSDI